MKWALLIGAGLAFVFLPELAVPTAVVVTALAAAGKAKK